MRHWAIGILLVGIATAGCIQEMAEPGRSGPETTTRVAWAAFAQDESNDILTVTSVAAPGDWGRVERRMSPEVDYGHDFENSGGHTSRGGTTGGPPMWGGIVSGTVPMRIGDRLCFAGEDIKGVSVDLRDSETLEGLGSWEFGALGSQLRC